MEVSCPALPATEGPSLGFGALSVSVRHCGGVFVVDQPVWCGDSVKLLFWGMSEKKVTTTGERWID